MATEIRDTALKPLGFEQITGLSVVKSLNVPANATLAVIQAESPGVRYRDDGIDPTAAVGMFIAGGTEIKCRGNLPKMRFIEGAAGAKLNVSYYE